MTVVNIHCKGVEVYSLSVDDFWIDRNESTLCLWRNGLPVFTSGSREDSLHLHFERVSVDATHLPVIMDVELKEQFYDA